MANEVKIIVSGDAQDAEAAFAKTRSGFAKLREDLKLTDANLRQMGRTMAFWGTGLAAVGFLTIRSAMQQSARYTDAAIAIDQFKVAIGDLSATLGKHLLPALATITFQLVAFLEGMNRFFDQHPAMARIVITIAALSAGFLILGGITLNLVVTLPKLAAAFRLLFLTVTTMNPLLLALTAAIGVGLFVWANWDTIINRVHGTIAAFKQGLAGKPLDPLNKNIEESIAWWKAWLGTPEEQFHQLGLILGTIRDNFLNRGKEIRAAWGALKAEITQIVIVTVNAVGTFFTITLPAWWEGLKGWFGQTASVTINFVSNTVGEWIPRIWGWIANGIPRLFVDFFGNALGGWIITIWEWITQGIRQLAVNFFGNVLGGWISIIWDWITNRIPTLAVNFFGNVLGGWISTIWGWITNGASVVVNFVAGGLDAVKAFVNGIIDFLNQQLDQTFLSFVNIPRLARGGRVSGAAIVGEQGPELAVFPPNTRIIPNNQLGPTGGGNTLVFHYHQNAPIYTLLDFEEQVVQAIRVAATSGGFRGVLVTE